MKVSPAASSIIKSTSSTCEPASTIAASSPASRSESVSCRVRRRTSRIPKFQEHSIGNHHPTVDRPQQIDFANEHKVIQRRRAGNNNSHSRANAAAAAVSRSSSSIVISFRALWCFSNPSISYLDRPKTRRARAAGNAPSRTAVTRTASSTAFRSPCESVAKRDRYLFRQFNSHAHDPYYPTVRPGLQARTGPTWKPKYGFLWLRIDHLTQKNTSESHFPNTSHERDRKRTGRRYAQ